MKITQRLQALKGSPTAQVKQLADALKRQGVKVFDFGVGEPDFPTPEPIKAAAVEALKANRTTYTAARGVIELRQAVAARYNRAYGTEFGPEHVVISVGAKQALYNLMLALVEPGDEVVLPAPYWVTYPAQIQLAGGTAVVLPTSQDEGFAVRAEALAACFSERTKVVLLNSPSNPTGSTLEAAELEKIARLTAERGIALVYDECYEGFVYEGEHHNPLSWDQGHVVAVSSASKTYAMTGWRIGWAIGPQEVIASLDRLQSQSTSNPTSIAQWAVLEALSGEQAPVRAMREEYRRRRESVLEALGGVEGLSCTPPGGAFYVFPDVSAFFNAEVPDSVALAKYLLERAHVAVVPGSAFGAEGHVRISYAAPLEALREGLARLGEALAALR